MCSESWALGYYIWWDILYPSLLYTDAIEKKSEKYCTEVYFLWIIVKSDILFPLATALCLYLMPKVFDCVEHCTMHNWLEKYK
jgi:hypothetical protein